MESTVVFEDTAPPHYGDEKPAEVVSDHMYEDAAIEPTTREEWDAEIHRAIDDVFKAIAQLRAAEERLNAVARARNPL